MFYTDEEEPDDEALSAVKRSVTGTSTAVERTSKTSFSSSSPGDESQLVKLPNPPVFQVARS